MTSRAAPFGGGTFVADTSAWRRAGQPRVRKQWVAALRNRQIAGCSVVMLEMLYSTQTEEELAQLDRAMRSLPEAPVTRGVMETALGAMRELMERPHTPNYHRVPIADYIVAAAAQEAGFGVLHYDGHFDRLSAVLSFDSRWIAPSGSL